MTALTATFSTVNSQNSRNAVGAGARRPRRARGLGGDGLEHLAGQPKAIGRTLGRGRDAHDDLVAVQLLQGDLRLAAHRRLDGRLEHLLHLERRDVGRQPRAQVDPVGLAQRHDGHVEHDRVGDHHLIVALGEGRVEQTQRADDPLDLPGDAAALQAHALADPEGPRAQQQGAGNEVAERLLRRETDDDRGEGAADRERARVEPGHPQRDDDREPDEDQADEEADRPRGAGVQAPEQGRAERPATSRAICQPRTMSTTVVAIWTGVSYALPNSWSR
jgi:hypothetical protein